MLHFSEISSLRPHYICNVDKRLLEYLCTLVSLGYNFSRIWQLILTPFCWTTWLHCQQGVFSNSNEWMNAIRVSYILCYHPLTWHPEVGTSEAKRCDMKDTLVEKKEGKWFFSDSSPNQINLMPALKIRNMYVQ